MYIKYYKYTFKKSNHVLRGVGGVNWRFEIFIFLLLMLKPKNGTHKSVGRRKDKGFSELRIHKFPVMLWYSEA